MPRPERERITVVEVESSPKEGLPDLVGRLGIDLSAALARIARDERIPLRPPVRKKSTSAKKRKRPRVGTGRSVARTRRA